MSRGPSLRGVGVVLMAIGLVTALAGGGFLGPGAESTLDEASPIGSVDALGFTAGVVLTGGLLAAGYVLDKYHSGADGDSTVAVDANETYQEVHDQSRFVKEEMEQSKTILNNTLGDGAHTLSWTHGKASFMDALAAGKNKSVARQWATENVSDYYATTETNTLRKWNTSIKELQYLSGVHESHSNLDAVYHYKDGDGTERSLRESNFVTEQVTLVNGSTLQLVVAKVDSTNWNTGDGVTASGTTIRVSPVAFGSGWDTGNDTQADNIERPMYIDANYSKPELRVADVRGYHAMLAEIDSQESMMSTNIEGWANQTYDAYQAGNVNITDVPDPVTLAKQFATDYNSTGHYAYAGADLAMMGVKTEMNTSFTVEVPSQNETLYGQIYTDWEPAATGGDLVTGHLYNVSKTDEIVYMATNGGLRAIGSDFKITSMTNVKTGEDKTSTTTENYNPQTSDVSLTEEQLQQLLEIREDIQEREEAAASGGGGFFDGLGLNADVAVPGLVVAAGAALVLLGRT